MVLPMPGVFKQGCSSSECYQIRRAMANSDPADTGPGPQTSESSQEGPSASSDSGSHRFIGIGMVAGLIFVLLVLWLTCASWPRRFMRARFKPRRHKELLVLGGGRDRSDSTPEVDVLFRPPKAIVKETRRSPSFESTVSRLAGDENNTRVWGST